MLNRLVPARVYGQRGSFVPALRLPVLTVTLADMAHAKED